MWSKSGQRTWRHFSKGRDTNGQHTKSCSTSAIMRDMESKTIMSYHLIPIRMTYQKRRDKRCRQGCGEKGTLAHCWWECNWHGHYGNWKFLKRLKIEVPYHPAIPFMGIYLKEIRCIPMFTAALFTIAKTLETTLVFSDRSMAKESVCVLEYYSAIKKGNPTVCKYMGETLRASEISHTKKDKYCMISLTCGI